MHSVNPKYMSFLSDYKFFNGNMKGAVEALMSEYKVDRLTAKFALADWFDSHN
jgi:hypothetical protein